MSHESVSNKPLIRHVNRQQMSWRAVDVEQLISEDHPARAIWTLVGRLDLGRFYKNIESSAEEGGRPAMFGFEVIAAVKATGIIPKRLYLRSFWQNGIAEREWEAAEEISWTTWLH